MRQNKRPPASMMHTNHQESKFTVAQSLELRQLCGDGNACEFVPAAVGQIAVGWWPRARLGKIATLSNPCGGASRVSSVKIGLLAWVGFAFVMMQRCKLKSILDCWAEVRDPRAYPPCHSLLM
jgi:hypothetical protein